MSNSVIPANTARSLGPPLLVCKRHAVMRSLCVLGHVGVCYEVPQHLPFTFFKSVGGSIVNIYIAKAGKGFYPPSAGMRRSGSNRRPVKLLKTGLEGLTGLTDVKDWFCGQPVTAKSKGEQA
jgi:hypothetical protein